MTQHFSRLRSCATMPVHERLLRSVPGYAEARAEIETAAWMADASSVLSQAGRRVIPVVVHVVSKGDGPEVTDDQVRSQIRILNEDYSASNSDIAKVPRPFGMRATDACVGFTLATVDPEGRSCDGIVRVRTDRESFTSDDGVKSVSTGGADPWATERYLNIWVCELSGGLLGYAQFPGGPPETDGVVILLSAFGDVGTAVAPFDRGRTTTHEVGHWLNLRHIWGDDGSGCAGSDFVDDTPNQAGPNYGKPEFPTVSCENGPDGDMFMNYMDYVDDSAMHMFTVGQASRMISTLEGSRSTLGETAPS